MLSTLAPELILQIYKSLDDHHSITSLNTTSRHFYQIWRANASSISDVVLQRSMDYYEDVCELVRFHPLRSTDCKGAMDAYQSTLDRNKQLLCEHALIRAAHEHFRSHLKLGAYSTPTNIQEVEDVDSWHYFDVSMREDSPSSEAERQLMDLLTVDVSKARGIFYLALKRQFPQQGRRLSQAETEWFVARQSA